MSKPRHDVFEIILMVIFVVTLARPLPSSATHFNKYGKILAALPRGERLLNPPASKLDNNDPSALFDQLDRDTPAKNLPKWHNLMDMIKIDNAQQLNKVKAKENTEHEESLLPLPLSAANNYARQQEQRQRHFERDQNEAADREFDQIMRKLKLKMQLEGENGASIKGVAKKDQFKNNILDNRSFSYCKKPKTKKKCSKIKPTTSTVTASRVFPSTTTVSSSRVSATTVSPSSTLSTTPIPIVRNKTIDRQLGPEDVDRLLRTSMSMKKRALLILKNLNLLEMELLNRWPDSNKYSCGSADEAHTTSAGSTETTTSKMHERLDKPTTPMPFLYNRSFYFGLQPQTPGEREVDLDLNVDAALREQRKLEQKIREEYQTQHDMMRPDNQRHLLHSKSLESKRKRARYEAAPAAAARLELMTTPSSSNSVVNKMRSSAAINNLAHKIQVYADRNHIDLTRQPLHSWKIMRKYMRKRKSKMLAPIIPEGFSESANGKIYSATCVRPQMQRVQRQQLRHRRTHQRLPLNKPQLTSV